MNYREGQKLLSVYVDEEMLEKYREFCKENGITVSDDVRTHIMTVLLTRNT